MLSVAQWVGHAQYLQNNVTTHWNFGNATSSRNGARAQLRGRMSGAPTNRAEGDRRKGIQFCIPVRTQSCVRRNDKYFNRLYLRESDWHARCVAMGRGRPAQI